MYDELQAIIPYIIDQGLKTLGENTSGEKFAIDYVAIFAKNENEFQLLNSFVQSLGQEVDVASAKTGHTYSLSQSMTTSVGQLRFIKIRKPDLVCPQRGAPDFTVPNYQKFKDKYIRSSGNFTLMLRKDYEMIEIKGIDVYVYIPEKSIAERVKDSITGS